MSCSIFLKDLLSEGKIEAHMSFTNGRGQGSLQTDHILIHGVHCGRRDTGAPIGALDWCYIHFLPFNRHLQRGGGQIIDSVFDFSGLQAGLTGIHFQIRIFTNDIDLQKYKQEHWANVPNFLVLHIFFKAKFHVDKKAHRSNCSTTTAN